MNTYFVHQRLHAALLPAAACAMLFAACTQGTIVQKDSGDLPVIAKIQEYAEVELKPDISRLRATEKQMLRTLMEVADIFDEIFWVQAFGNKEEMTSLGSATSRMFALMNYGPWDRLNANKSFVPAYGSKPPGANFYPADMTKMEYLEFDDVRKDSRYTMLRRDEGKRLTVIPYNEYFREPLERVSKLLRKAAELANNVALQKYLVELSDAVLNNYYYQSNVAWMGVHGSYIDFIAGPIMRYEDGLYEDKAAFQSMLLVRDVDWSRRVARYNQLLVQIKNQLPYDQQYKNRMVTYKADIGVYDALYYSGYSNTGDKTIMMNLPQDDRVYELQGSRKLQIKNVMQAKYEKMLEPVADLMIDESQRKYLKFDAFFENTLFRNIAIDWRFHLVETPSGESLRSVMKEALLELDEARSLISAMFIARQLVSMGEIKQSSVENFYVTFLADIFMQMRYDVANVNGRSSMLVFNYLQDHGVVERTAAGKYAVNVDRMETTVTSLLSAIFTVQSTGDYPSATAWLINQRKIDEPLLSDLGKINKAKVPRDLLLKQGVEVLELTEGK